MSTVRFAKVVETCGKPEVFLLLSRDDPDFQKALKANRIMSLFGSIQGKTDFGEIGYAEKKRPQLLLFPKSLKKFEGQRVVGIRYEEFSEAAREPRPPKVKKAFPKTRLRKEKITPAPKVRKTKVKPSKKKVPGKAKRTKAAPHKNGQEKVIPFPLPTIARDEEEDSDLEKSVRQAMALLEKGNSVAAYNVLKNAIAD